MDKAIGILAPFDCMSCGLEGSIVCANCLDSISLPRRSNCFRCNKLTKDWRTCNKCQRHTKIRGVIVVSHYEGIIKDLVGRLKYERAVSSAKVLAAVLMSHIPKGEIDLITWVPSSAKRHRQRGYNPVELIASQVAGNLELPRAPTLGKLGDTRQVGSSRSDRLIQLKGSIYSSNKKAHGKRVLLVDDILTTGATMSECAEVLYEAGAKSIWGAAIAKH